MFRNKIVLRACPPSAASPFLLRQLSLVPDPSPSPSSLASVDVETLCWSISRRWRLACFVQFSTVFLVYQRAQSQSVHRALEEFAQAVPAIDIGMEEEVASAPLVAKAVEIGLRMLMFDHNWTCVGDNTFVHSTFAENEETKHVGALNLIVQSDMDDGLVLLASPEVLRFSRYKVTDLVSSIFWRSFNEGEKVMLGDYNVSRACTIIPSLCEAHAIGVCKMLPNEENTEKLGLLLSLKHGLTLKSDYFISVQLAYGSHTNKWFPASYIFQGHGFSPAPKTIRSLKAKETVDSFMNLFGDWDFFNMGQLKIKDVLPIGIGTDVPVWIKATNHLTCQIERNKEHADDQESADISLLSLDFRTPKPGIWFVGSNRNLQYDHVQKIATSRSKLKISTEHISTGVNINSTTDSQVSPGSTSIQLDLKADHAWKPSFTKRKVLEVNKCRVSSSQLSDDCLSEKKHICAEVAQSEDHSQSSKCPRGNKENSKALPGIDKSFPQKNISAKSEKAAGYKFHKRENPTEDSKMRARQRVDQSVITEKVMNCYKRGELKSLTVLDLKCFLASKKAKVGGKKEELITRVTSLFS